MVLIITMAGRYERFANEGYKLPKYLLPWGDRTVLWTILKELNSAVQPEKTYFIANQRDEEFDPHIRKIIRSLGVNRQNIRYIEDTSGQAETAFLGLNLVNVDVKEPILFHNADTILYGRDFSDIDFDSSSGYIDVFKSSNKEYSYVVKNDQEEVIEIAEKVVISDIATSGLYGFKNSELFNSYYYASNQKDHISEIYRFMINEGLMVRTGKTHKESDTIVLGSPAEYTNAAQRYL